MGEHNHYKQTQEHDHNKGINERINMQAGLNSTADPLASKTGLDFDKEQERQEKEPKRKTLTDIMHEQDAMKHPYAMGGIIGKPLFNKDAIDAIGYGLQHITDPMSTLGATSKEIGQNVKIGRTIARTMDENEIDNMFAYHKPANDEVSGRHDKVRELCKQLAYELGYLLPNSNEKAQTLLKLNEVMFWANAAIARNDN